jgi:hypothetical protein
MRLPLSQRIRLKGYYGLRSVVGFGTPPQEIITISVTNIGVRGTIINNISMPVRHFRRKRHAIITVMKDQYSVGIPYSLTDGQKADSGIILDPSKTWIRDHCKNFIRNPSDVRSLKFFVHTNHGEKALLHTEDSFRQALYTELEQINSESPHPSSAASGVT